MDWAIILFVMFIIFVIIILVVWFLAPDYVWWAVGIGGVLFVIVILFVFYEGSRKPVPPPAQPQLMSPSPSVYIDNGTIRDQYSEPIPEMHSYEPRSVQHIHIHSGNSDYTRDFMNEGYTEEVPRNGQAIVRQSKLGNDVVDPDPVKRVSYQPGQVTRGIITNNRGELNTGTVYKAPVRTETVYNPPPQVVPNVRSVRNSPTVTYSSSVPAQGPVYYR